MTLYQHISHPHIAARRRQGPVLTTAEHIGLNGKVALALTTAVGTMWCAYAFALLALLVVPQAIHGGLLTFVQWISQTFIQLVMLSVIVVGQNILGRASDKRAIQTYEDAEAILAEATKIQDHLQLQDAVLEQLVVRVAEALKGVP